MPEGSVSGLAHAGMSGEQPRLILIENRSRMDGKTAFQLCFI
ncbi:MULTISPECIES: hypothetical protein [Clostridia]|nr:MULTISPECIES: hypothetical protein [Clostridia]